MIDMQSEHERITGEAILSEREIVSRAERRITFSGIYFLIKDGRIVYIGQSTNVEERIAQHVETKDFDSFTYVQATGDQLDVLESIYIHHFQPELNARRRNDMLAPLPPQAVKSCQVSIKALSGYRNHIPDREGEPEATINLDFLD